MFDVSIDIHLLFPIQIITIKGLAVVSCLLFIFSFEFFPIVVIRHIRSCNDQVILDPSKTMSSHIPLVLLQDNRPSRDTNPSLTNTTQWHFQITLHKRLLQLPSHHLIHRQSQNTRPRRKQRAERMHHRKLRIRTHHPIVIHHREPIPNVIHHPFDRPRQVWMRRRTRDKSIPKAHAMIRLDPRSVDRHHESHIGWNGRVQVTLQHDIHIGVDSALDEEDAVTK
mmetsp:Transcript_34419/g.61820  ORF Transcript_34419/g.61820 Transcript_34419/m.61820 type:complete len:224 (-) Transcript_34419:1971-2642(-)